MCLARRNASTGVGTWHGPVTEATKAPRGRQCLLDPEYAMVVGVVHWKHNENQANECSGALAREAYDMGSSRSDAWRESR